MSLDQAKAFMALVSGDKELQVRLGACDSSAERFIMARELGFTFSAEELKLARTELSDEDLDAVAGGEDFYSIFFDGP